ncbi:MAG: hypothetical protein JSS28_01225 [Proteobacteria bacterium]|nr:hypothetical protein [Pseudomonadota bacterium]
MHIASVNRHRKPLAVGIATVLALAATIADVAAAPPTTWTVNTCNEASVGSGNIGSLRYAAANAASGDTIDMTNIGCSTITLTTGAIFLPQDDITVKGPGKTVLTITGGNDRVFTHNGHGAFALNDLAVANGYVHPSVGVKAKGGCISSNGSINLDHVSVRYCKAKGYNAAARGGGVYAADDVSAKYSDINGNLAFTNGSATGNPAGGAGIFSYKSVLLGESTIAGNQTTTGQGGGFRAFANVTVIASTVSGNLAANGAGIYAQDNLTSASDSFTLLNSTVSGNQAFGLVGGAWTNAGTIHVYNSTVAFNSASSATANARHYAPGLSISDQGADPVNSVFKTVRLQSSLFSNNFYGFPTHHADDIGVAKFTSPSTNGTPTSGGNNLAFATTIIGLPNTLTTGACPLLGPLRDNGGPTQTHALMSHSPAIDAGNTLGSGVSIYDQRGSARVSNGTADIGAYEVQQADIVFNAGFDGCP